MDMLASIIVLHIHLKKQKYQITFITVVWIWVLQIIN